LRLLLDEMDPSAVAEQLRHRGYDVSAVTERSDLRSLDDPALFGLAQQERRAIVTENIADFIPLADAADQRGQRHQGLILIDPAKFPRGNQWTIGRLVAELEAVLKAYADDKPRNIRHWL
jgi:predicted nuclease of predicted toxin-antitoxin system